MNDSHRGRREDAGVAIGNASDFISVDGRDQFVRTFKERFGISRSEFLDDRLI